MLKNIRHTGIVVENLDVCLSFYQQLGFEIVKQADERGVFIENVLGLDNVEVKTVKLADSRGCMVELLHFTSPQSRPVTRRIFDTGISHMAFTVDDIDSEYNQLSSIGIEFLSTPQVSPDGGAKVAFCRDPEGNILELVEELS